MKLYDYYVFVGHDGAGKSSLARAFSDLYDYKYFKNNREQDLFLGDSDFNHKDHLRYCGPMILEFLKQTQPHKIVFDRGNPCEYAYGQTYRPGNVDLELVAYLDEEWAKNFDVCIVHCYKTDLSHITDNTVDVSKLVDVRDQYFHYLELTQQNNMSICMDDENIENQIAQITIHKT